MSEPPGQTSEQTPPPTHSDTHLPRLGPRGEGWFMLQLVGMAVIALAGFLFGPDLSGAPRFAAALAGAVLILGGVLLGILGIRDLGGSLSPFPMPIESAVLVSEGIYRRLRHPIYAGVILVALGWSLLTASLAALVLTAVLAVLLDLKARREEAWLRERYRVYAAYAEQTSRFVPGVY